MDKCSHDSHDGSNQDTEITVHDGKLHSVGEDNYALKIALTVRAMIPEVEKQHAEVKKFTLPQSINTWQDIEKLQEKISMYKATYPLGKLFFLGTLAGIWCGFAVILVLTIAGGIPSEVRTTWPCLPKLVAGFFFPVAIFLIIFFGGELFTGNAMVMLIGLFAKRVTLLQLAYNWSVVLVSNFVGCVLTVYVFAKLTDLFHDDPWKSYAMSIAVYKVNLPPHVVFLRAIPANALVCTSVLLGQLSQDMTGRIIAMWFPIMIFATCGYEHAIANMAFIPAGLMFGADQLVDYRHWLYQNLLLAILGNIVGGGLAVGGTVFYLFNWSKAASAAGGPKLLAEAPAPFRATATLLGLPEDAESTAFHIFDADCDGSLGVPEVLCALETIGLRFSMALVTSLMRSQTAAAAGAFLSDDDGGGKVEIDLAGFRWLVVRLRELQKLGLVGNC